MAAHHHRWSPRGVHRQEFADSAFTESVQHAVATHCVIRLARALATRSTAHRRRTDRRLREWDHHRATTSSCRSTKFVVVVFVVLVAVGTHEWFPHAGDRARTLVMSLAVVTADFRLRARCVSVVCSLRCRVGSLYKRSARRVCSGGRYLRCWSMGAVATGDR